MTLRMSECQFVSLVCSAHLSSACMYSSSLAASASAAAASISSASFRRADSPPKRTALRASLQSACVATMVGVLPYSLRPACDVTHHTLSVLVASLVGHLLHLPPLTAVARTWLYSSKEGGRPATCKHLAARLMQTVSDSNGHKLWMSAWLRSRHPCVWHSNGGKPAGYNKQFRCHTVTSLDTDCCCRLLVVSASLCSGLCSTISWHECDVLQSTCHNNSCPAKCNLLDAG